MNKLADIIFKGEYTKNIIAEKISKMLGDDDEFFEDYWFDSYDSSIEILFSEKFRGLTKEEVDAILDLGFSIVYETIGDKGYHWNKAGRSECRTQTLDEESSLLFKYKRELMKLKSEQDAHENAGIENEI